MASRRLCLLFALAHDGAHMKPLLKGECTNVIVGLGEA